MAAVKAVVFLRKNMEFAHHSWTFGVLQVGALMERILFVNLPVTFKDGGQSDLEIWVVLFRSFEDIRSVLLI